jgi:hypothetical protein
MSMHVVEIMIFLIPGISCIETFYLYYLLNYVCLSKNCAIEGITKSHELYYVEFFRATL